MTKTFNMSNLKSLVLMDFYAKNGPELYPEQYASLNQRVIAMHKLYHMLYCSGILQNISFEYKEYDDMVYFAFEVKDLEEFFNDCEDEEFVALIAQYLENCITCIFTGAIQPGIFMQTYRDNNGCIGKSHECIIAQWLDNEGCGIIYNTRKISGVKDAVKMAFKLANFK